MLSATILYGGPAAARYEYDPADLPKGFRCDPDEPAEKCPSEQEAEAYWQKYGDQYDRWHFGLAHDPIAFFSSSVWSQWHDPASADYAPKQYPGGLIDLRYTIALRRYDGWTMVIDADCDTHAKPAKPSTCNVLARVSRKRQFDRDDPVDRLTAEKIEAELNARGNPTSAAELAHDLDLYMDWREADLWQCRGALALLKKFPARQAKLWPDTLFNLLDGSSKPVARQTDEARDIIVTADGDAIDIRADSAIVNEDRDDFRGGTYFITISEANRGNYYDWAKRLAGVVEPCLGPATAPSPWSAYRAWKGDDTKGDQK